MYLKLKLEALAQALPDCVMTPGLTHMCTCIIQIMHTLHSTLWPDPWFTRSAHPSVDTSCVDFTQLGGLLSPATTNILKAGRVSSLAHGSRWLFVLFVCFVYLFAVFLSISCTHHAPYYTCTDVKDCSTAAQAVDSAIRPSREGEDVPDRPRGTSTVLSQYWKVKRNSTA